MPAAAVEGLPLPANVYLVARSHGLGFADAVLPFGPLGIKYEKGARIPLSISRCDVPKGGERRCGAFRGALELR